MQFHRTWFTNLCSPACSQRVFTSPVHHKVWFTTLVHHFGAPLWFTSFQNQTATGGKLKFLLFLSTCSSSEASCSAGTQGHLVERRAAAAIRKRARHHRDHLELGRGGPRGLSADGRDSNRAWARSVSSPFLGDTYVSIGKVVLVAALRQVFVRPHSPVGTVADGVRRRRWRRGGWGCWSFGSRLALGEHAGRKGGLGYLLVPLLRPHVVSALPSPLD